MLKSKGREKVRENRRDGVVVLGGDVEDVRDDLLLLLQGLRHLLVLPAQLLDLSLQRLHF